MKINSLPIISVGLICYNAEETIQRAIESALSQDWPNLEILIVDDGSIDASIDIIQPYLVNKNVKLVQHPHNMGVAVARNTVLEHAKGDFIVYFDDDDYSYPERIVEQYHRIMNYDESVDNILCYTNREVVPDGSDKVDHISKGIGYTSPEPHGLVVVDQYLLDSRPSQYKWGATGSCTLMASKELFSKVGKFDPFFRRCAEWDYAIRAAFMGAHFISVDKDLVRQYKTFGKQKSGKNPLIYTLALAKKHSLYLRSNGLYWISIANIHAHFHQFRGNRFRYYFFKKITKSLRMVHSWRKIMPNR
ncbi:MAG: hypothetical protein CL942_06200 [Desulfovibrio sp.]|nr:hypothetical protein [Desulfovibrio sp.]|tara:strand:- start:12874 stop:13785 length:912 start_codon:yes stop_codon:yes gene_type:complete